MRLVPIIIPGGENQVGLSVLHQNWGMEKHGKFAFLIFGAKNVLGEKTL
jgi:hypothetical protein